ncbi:MAG TPA: cell wall hydrolase [Alphaproteobacteria bacterium]|nr:cell wall hydrolase [Alphaproteobacteria bacterium]
MRWYLGTAVVALGVSLSMPAHEAVAVNRGLISPAIAQPAEPSFYERLAGLDPQEVRCLARNIYYEARGETPEGQLAVAYVTLNRLHDARFPKTICKVVYQPGAFSWTADRQKRAAKLGEETPWRLAVVIAQMAMLGMIEDPTNGAVDYHAVSVHPWWMSEDLFVKQMGHHKFYARPEPSGMQAAAAAPAAHAPLNLIAAHGGSAVATARQPSAGGDPELAMLPASAEANP